MANLNRICIWQMLTAITFLLSMAAATQSGWQQPGAIEQPHGTWQVPGQIQQPKGPWQKPGTIQVPKGIQAINQESFPCESRISVGADALFDFNRSELRSDATTTLEKLGPAIRRFGTHPIEIDGHTDGIGSLSYNQQLSEARAETVKAWLVKRDFIPVSTPINGYGKTRPIAPNRNLDGSDNPLGRQRNRRVEIVINTCQ
ncbi:MAG: OmpA family protein [Deltaproteobacteria bacterium]|nr:OmpA family protein [Deltaproteobacteria bacterium]MBV8452078.1 OmpA family protein [Deltaproteobacteria bacterium]